MDRPAIGLDDSTELVQRAAAIQIIRQLPIQIPLQEALWANRDADWALATGRPLTSTTITPVNPKSVYTGHRLDLQVAPQDTFPAITSRCFDSVPAPDAEQPDQYDQAELTLVIEVWVSCGPFIDPVADHDDQDQIDRQLHRLSAAVRASIDFDRSLGSVVMPIRLPARTRASLPFVTKATERNIDRSFLVQAMELTYTASALVQ